jgi:beta-glucosidase
MHAASDRPEPRPQADQSWHRLVRNHREQLSVRRADICLIGDSLTQFWEEQGRIPWQAQFRRWRTVNCGIAADRVEHVLYRVGQLNLAAAKPHVVVLLAGTNNLGAEVPDSPEQVARGCAAIVSLIQKASTETRIVLLSIPPSGNEPESALRRSIRQTNALLAEVARSADAEYVEIYPLLVDEHDAWKKSFTLDGTHFTEAGYSTLAAILRPVVDKLLEPHKE